VIEIYEGVGGPEAVAQLLASDDVTGPLQKLGQNLKRLLLQLDFPSLTPQFAGTQIQFEDTELARVLAARSIRTPHNFGH
jgi:hypothetical protein